jgi:peptidoglycan/LPS O-acetylase OafA/YrhL
LIFADVLRQARITLNAVRLLLAIFVIIRHAAPIGGFGFEMPLGYLVVSSFFALSGLLVSLSALRNSSAEFLIARLRRIMPAYLFVLAAVALVLAPIVYVISHGSLVTYSWSSQNGPIAYLFGNALLSVDVQYRINEIFVSTTPYGVVNGSIWTLPVEARAYLIALCVVAIGRRFGLTRSAVIALVTTCGFMVLDRFDPTTAAAVLPEFFPPEYARYFYIFLCGSVVATLASRITLTHTKGIAALLLLFGSAQQSEPLFRQLGLGTLVIVIPYIASLLPTRHFRWFTNDLSYGTFLWGFPVAQVLAFAGLNSLGLAPFALLSVLCTLPFAAVSWFLVERRFIKRHAPPKAAATKG